MGLKTNQSSKLSETEKENIADAWSKSLRSYLGRFHEQVEIE